MEDLKWHSEEAEGIREELPGIFRLNRPLQEDENAVIMSEEPSLAEKVAQGSCPLSLGGNKIELFRSAVMRDSATGLNDVAARGTSRLNSLFPA